MNCSRFAASLTAPATTFSARSKPTASPLRPLCARRRSSASPRPIPPKTSTASTRAPNSPFWRASDCTATSPGERHGALDLTIDVVDFAFASQLAAPFARFRGRVQKRLKNRVAGGRVVCRRPPFAGRTLVAAGTRRRQPNLVVATGTYGGETVFGGHGAGGHPTAVAVVSDILAIARSRQSGPQSATSPAGQPVEITPPSRRFHRQSTICVSW